MENKIEFFKYTAAIITSISPIILAICKSSFRDFYIRNKYVNTVKQLQMIFEKNEDAKLKKHAEIILNEYKFSTLANCEYSIRNEKLFDYCMINKEWLVWSEVKAIKNYFDVDDSELKIKFKSGDKYAYRLSWSWLVITFIAAAVVAWTTLLLKNNLFGFLVFAFITMLSLIPLVLLRELIDNKKLLQRIIDKGDLKMM